MKSIIRYTYENFSTWLMVLMLALFSMMMGFVAAQFFYWPLSVVIGVLAMPLTLLFMFPLMVMGISLTYWTAWIFFEGIKKVRGWAYR